MKVHRRDILICFLSESLMLCCLGGMAGVLTALLLNVLTFETSDFNSFVSRTFGFRLGPFALGVAVVITLPMGMFGGVMPALRGVRLDVISALREL